VLGHTFFMMTCKIPAIYTNRSIQNFIAQLAALQS